MNWLKNLFAGASLSIAGTSFYDHKVQTIDGQDFSLEDLRGKTVLVVNVASKCGFTPQYQGLESLYQKYKDQGLVILGFPSNDFLWQEPGGSSEIKQVCYLKYQVHFPMMSKIVVKNKKGQDPLYTWLTHTPIQGKTYKVSWNFNKYLISPQGELLAHFPSSVEPMAPELTEAIERSLAP